MSAAAGVRTLALLCCVATSDPLPAKRKSRLENIPLLLLRCLALLLLAAMFSRPFFRGDEYPFYAIIYPHQEALDAYAEANETGPLSLRDVEEIIRKEILERGKALADYKRIKRFTLREDEFPKTTTRKIKRFVVEADINTGEPENQGLGAGD